MPAQEHNTITSPPDRCSRPTTDSHTVSASLLTVILTIPDILKQNFILSSTLSTHLIHFLRVLSEFFLIALWCAAFVTMLLPKGKDFRLLFHRPPYVQWDCAVALAAIELYVKPPPPPPFFLA